jgi:homoserine O-acetyltransferase
MAMTQVPHGQLYVIPASVNTRGHGTTDDAALWAPQLRAFLQGVPERPPI